jgi:diguanylate cyclase (GGDEF)-like protein
MEQPSSPEKSTQPESSSGADLAAELESIHAQAHPEDKISPNTPEAHEMAKLEDVWRTINPLAPNASPEERQKYDNTAYVVAREQFMDLHTGTAGGPYTKTSRGERQSHAAAIEPEAIEDNRRKDEQLLVDALTNLSSQRAYEIAKERIINEEASNPNRSFSSYDANSFKNINDKYGHEVGDAALKLLADTLVLAAQSEGVSTRSVFRSGGDEMAIIINDDPGSDKAERIRQRFNELLQEHYDRNDSLIYGPANQSIPIGYLQKERLGLSGGTGRSFEEADKQQKKQKKTDKHGTGIAGQARRLVGKLRDRR